MSPSESDDDRKDAVPEHGDGQGVKTQVAVNATVPAVFRAFELEFQVGPSTLGKISMCQALAQSLSAPFWGYLADNVSRRNLLSTGCVLVAIATLSVSQSESIGEIAMFRGLAGVGLAIVGPIAQSLIADLVVPAKRGFAFGLLGVTAGIGSMGGTIFAGSMSKKVVYGMAGWRVAFMFVAGIELFLAATVLLVVKDPERGALDKLADSQPQIHPEASEAESEDARRDDEILEEADSENLEHQPLIPASAPVKVPATVVPVRTPPPPGISIRGLWLWMRSVVAFFKIPTFVLIVCEGLTLTLPWNAMVFLTLYLQYMGFADTQASTIFSFIYVGGMFGQMFGGWMGDILGIWSPAHGRILAAQASMLLAIPTVLVFFFLLPRDTNSTVLFGINLFVLGLVCTWTSAACNRPILAEIVDPSSRASIFAVLIALEGAIGSFGPPCVGLLAENVFGYVRTDVSIAEMSDDLRQNNLDALGHAVTLVMVVPWLACFCFFGVIHTTYWRDKSRIYRARWGHK